MKNQKGITLIALVITIIVMLILVAVTVTIALNGGLFTTAKEASSNYQNHMEDEKNISNGQVTVNGTTYQNYNEYLQTL